MVDIALCWFIVSAIDTEGRSIWNHYPTDGAEISGVAENQKMADSKMCDPFFKLSNDPKNILNFNRRKGGVPPGNLRTICRAIYEQFL